MLFGHAKRSLQWLEKALKSLCVLMLARKDLLLSVIACVIEFNLFLYCRHVDKFSKSSSKDSTPVLKLVWDLGPYALVAVGFAIFVYVNSGIVVGTYSMCGDGIMYVCARISTVCAVLCVFMCAYMMYGLEWVDFRGLYYSFFLFLSQILKF